MHRVLCFSPSAIQLEGSISLINDCLSITNTSDRVWPRSVAAAAVAAGRIDRGLTSACRPQRAASSCPPCRASATAFICSHHQQLISSLYTYQQLCQGGSCSCLQPAEAGPSITAVPEGALKVNDGTELQPASASLVQC